MKHPAIERRRFMQAVLLGAAYAAPATGFAMRKNNVRTLQKTLGYLLDPSLRKKEAGDSILEVRNVEIAGVDFGEILWRSMKFIDCDFVGAYEVKTDMEAVTFAGCRFAGIFNFGKLTSVDFVQCTARAGTFVVGGVGSKGVRFSDCTFTGTDVDPNRWGGMGSYGETEFVRCKMKWANVVSETRHTIVDCDFDNVDCTVSKDGGGSEVLIEGSRLRGKFDMRPATLLSLTVRDTVLEELDFSGATVKETILFERVKGGYINAYVKEAGRLSVRNSQIFGNGTKVFEAYAGGIRAIDIDNVVFGGDLSNEPVTIAGGTGLDLANVRARVSDSVVIQASKVPRLNTHHIHTSLFQMQGCTLDSLVLSNSRIARLELTANTIARSADFTHTQAR
jgi:uncharacterized protein YjbI with pentapeptide repeats